MRFFARRKTFGSSGYPFNLARPEALDYDPASYPGTLAALERILVVPWNDLYDEDDVRYIAGAISSAAADLTCEVAS